MSTTVVRPQSLKPRIVCDICKKSYVNIEEHKTKTHRNPGTIASGEKTKRGKQTFTISKNGDDYVLTAEGPDWEGTLKNIGGSGEVDFIFFELNTICKNTKYDAICFFDAHIIDNNIEHKPLWGQGFKKNGDEIDIEYLKPYDVIKNF